MTVQQINYFHHHLPLVELRRHLPVAQLEAALRNALGGKPEPGESGKALPRERLYTAYELLPPYAQPDELGSGLATAAARDFLANIALMPSWVLQIAPLDDIHLAADG